MNNKNNINSRKSVGVNNENKTTNKNDSLKKTNAVPTNMRKPMQNRTAQPTAMKQAQKPKLTEAEKKAQNEKRKAAEAQRQRILKEEAGRKAAIRKKKRERFGAYVFLVFIVFILMSAVFSTVFYINLVSYKKADINNYPLVLSDYENSLTVGDGYIVGENGNRYVNFSQIADFYDFGMVGSINNMKYVIKGDESETISFSVGSDKAFINDVQVQMPGEAYYIDGDLFVDEKFISTYINGFKIENDSENKSLKFARILLNPVDSEGKIADGNPPTYEDISFKLKSPALSVSISENDSAVEIPTYTFNLDLSAYEEYMNPGSTTEFLTLVNSENPLEENYIPTGLAMINVGNGMYLKDYAAKSFEALYKEANACGISGLTVTKAYVSYDELSKQYENTVMEFTPILGAQQAKRYAEATVSAPGHDEHQAGLTVDLSLGDGVNFETSVAYSWLSNNAHKFGFVLRYPNRKSNSNEYSVNANQLRYVGRYHAVRMNVLGYSLEEYVEYLGL